MGSRPIFIHPVYTECLVLHQMVGTQKKKSTYSGMVKQIYAPQGNTSNVPKMGVTVCQKRLHHRVTLEMN